MSDTHKTESLHDQIMRLPCDPAEYTNVNMMLAYKDGHRDARHAAAELAAAYEADAQQAAQAAVPDDLRQRCAEILDWQKSGVLAVGALRNFAANQFYRDEHNCLQMAEADTAREAYRLIAKAAPTPPEGTWESPCIQPAQQPVGYFVRRSGFGPHVEVEPTEAGAIPLYAAPPAQQSPLYTCIGKGGRYEKVGSANPAGIANFEHNIGAVIVYRDIESDHLYFRLPLDFNRRMKRISPGDTAAPEQAERDANLCGIKVVVDEAMAPGEMRMVSEPATVKVPRELLADLISLDHDTRIQAERRLYVLLGGGA